jgi:predicted nucleic acid-binding protein
MPANIFSFKSDPPKITYVDPSFFLNLFVKDSKYFEGCREFSEKLKEKKTILIVSNLGLDEIWYVLLRLLAMKDFGKKWRKKLKDKEVVKNYTKEIGKYTANLMEIPNLFFVETSTYHTFHALEIMRKFGLLPRDAIHASITLSGIENIITLDEDFVRVDEINVYTCNPNILRK